MDNQERRHADQERILMLEHKLESLENKLQSLEDKMDNMNDSISGLIQAWNTGKGASTFLIASAKLAGACTVMWALLRNVKWSQIFL